MLNKTKHIKLFGLGEQPGIKPVFYFLIILLFSFKSIAQDNLVPNGSFEEYNWCPVGIADFSVKDWYIPNLASSDYFNTCSSLLGDAGVPKNFIGYQEAHSGNGYVGFSSCFSSSANYREYIQVELNEELKENQCYTFSCYLSLADSSMYCSSNIAFVMSQNPISMGYLLTTPIYSSTEKILSDNFICDTIDWLEVSRTIIAVGGEKYLTIGIFRDDENTNFKYFNKNVNSNDCAYYYIDDVEVIEVNCPERANVFTPNNDGVNDKLVLLYVPENTFLKILNRWGDVVFETLTPNQEFWDGTSNNGKLCIDGVYYYLLQDKQGNKKTGFVHLIR